MDDDEIVDAEIIDDEMYAPAEIKFLPAEYRGVTPNLQPRPQANDLVLRVPSDQVLVPLTLAQRQLLREALGHYYQKGPRQRNTSQILRLIEHMADHEPMTNCNNCNNTGRVRSMYDVQYCGCHHGLRAMDDGRKNSDLY